jgi:hypothetical protein
LAKPAVKLINGEAIGAKNKEKPLKDGKKPRSVYGGLILRNIRGDKTRVLITIVSIAGCCTLLMIGFTLKMGFEGVIKHQFGEIMKCETVIQFDLEEEFSIETALVVCEIYRKNGEWKFNAVAAGYQGGLEALCRNYGVDVG